jgi:hypothetical protein
VHVPIAQGDLLDPIRIRKRLAAFADIARISCRQDEIGLCATGISITRWTPCGVRSHAFDSNPYGVLMEAVAWLTAG